MFQVLKCNNKQYNAQRNNNQPANQQQQQQEHGLFEHYCGTQNRFPFQIFMEH